MATTTTKSPNDARRASFGPSVSFHLLRVFFYILTNTLLYIQVIFYIINDRTATKTRKSPNDDGKRASFGPYVSFFLFFFVFFILTNVLLYIQVIIYVIHDMEGVGR